ncbi:Scr1 family TA system antitoxin-like transcriptional regulator [Streptomonospora salina]|uniref:DUF5753 domain-containing protein n=1 Tax=Streptomonospora salina TaxID=104205 RepID=A0A841EEF5_9ACTN|nr:Scr1 family TA system antitoxin-like transcriptional regulator [Streptomonospora salina]MBB5997811.1 hypothetical protein [Streptomonospora salina]
MTLQLVPLDVGLHPGVTGAFAIMNFASASTIVYAETLTDGLYVERDEEIDAYRKAFDHLKGFARSPRATTARIRELMP